MKSSPKILVAARCCAGAFLISSAVAGNAQEPNPARPKYEATRLPASLRDVPLEHLSSGALLGFDSGGDLVETPEAWRARVAEITANESHTRKAAVALDLRVGANIRVGDDPAALPDERRAQAEPHIVRAPGNPDFLVAIFQEGRITTGGAVSCGYGVSHDGGLTWTRALIPNLSIATGGAYDVASDPVAGIDANGVAYLNTLGVNETTPRRGALLVSRSSDGGATFEPPVVAYDSPSNEFFPDKNWMAVNSFTATPTAGRIVVTFTLFSNTIGVTSRPIARVLSDDGGRTWSGMQTVSAPTAQTQGSQPVFLPDGRLAVMFWNFNGTSNTNADDFIQLAISNDGGTTFTPPKFVTAVPIYNHPLIRDAVVLPSMAGDRTTGHLYITYQARHNGAPRIMFTKSTNAGDSWTTPIPISDNPAGSAVINPAIAASPDGQTLSVAFYDARDNPGSQTHLDMYLAQSFDGGATWQPSIRLTTESTNAALAPMSGNDPNNPQYMLGDYQGIAESTGPNVPAVPVWIDTRTGNPDPYVTRIGMSPTVNFTAWQAARLSLGQINDPRFGGEAGDADRDGEDNLSEYRSGTDPNDPLSIFRTGQLLNISTRALVQTGDNILIGGFIITGAEPKVVAIRAIGPSTAEAGVVGPLEDPILQVFTRDGGTVALNDDWKEVQQSAIENSGLAPSDERESATIQTLPPGEYTAAVRGKNGATGVALVEVFDLTTGANAQLANISTRSFVGTGENVLIGGIIIGSGQGSGGAGSVRVLVRGIGPSLADSGVSGALQNPMLQLFNANGEVLATNDDWRETQEPEIQQTGIPPTDDREPAILTPLTQGNYTAIVRGSASTTGVALVEVYHLP